MTDRTIRTSADLDALRFQDVGEAPPLLPVVAQDVESGSVLMVAHASREALVATLESSEMHFWSRSRGELWRKGATSGNTLTVVSLHTDCDADAVLARVRPAGAACHTGDATCFGDIAGAAARADSGPERVLLRLDAVLASRAAERPDASYTTQLLEDGNLRLKKLGEECAELVAALASGDSARATEEAADLLYHTMVALRAGGVGVQAMLATLESRSSS